MATGSDNPGPLDAGEIAERTGLKKNEILYIGFNQDQSCFVCGADAKRQSGFNLGLT